MKRRPHHRYPVREPLAGILSDWFGVESGAAKVLLALYRTSAPLSAAGLAGQAAICETGVKAIISRLRRAGIAIPPTSKWHSEYALPESAKREVRKAFDNAAALLNATDAENDQLRSRITVLEDALGMSAASVPNEYGLTKAEASIFGMLAKTRAPVSKERLFWAMYGDRLDPPEDKVIDVMVSKIRAKIAPFGLEIVNHFGFGYSLRQSVKVAA